MNKKNFKKLLLTLIFLSATAGILINIYGNTIEVDIWKGLSIFKYFTLQSNALVAIFAFIALFNITGLNDKPMFKNLLSPLTSYIMLTGLAFAILLAPTSTVQGLLKVASDILHYIVPPLMVFYWLVFEERKLEYNFVYKWLIYPVIFMVWGLFRAFVLEDYLYPFFDPTKYGYFLILYLMAMSISTIGIGYFLVFINNKLRFPRVS